MQRNQTCETDKIAAYKDTVKVIAELQSPIGGQEFWRLQIWRRKIRQQGYTESQWTRFAEWVEDRIMILQVINFNLIEFVIAELWSRKIEDRVW